ncbi:glutamate ligase domain-containing protein [Piscibacillus salipiscarius]|uniref:glutamate ligase domain-containing protein n=1 Tax=Piscibacillus salipiscarius TaxID=299480 RepID=UPI003F7198CD
MFKHGAGANQVIHVFGFRGSRDPSKRKAMMDKSAKVSDYYILTLDDLNNSTMSEMEETLNEFHQNYGKGEVIYDRTKAIERAIEFAEDGDWVVITGKGHESYKEEFELGTSNDLETVKTFKRQS